MNLLVYFKFGRSKEQEVLLSTAFFLYALIIGLRHLICRFWALCIVLFPDKEYAVRRRRRSQPGTRTLITEQRRRNNPRIISGGARARADDEPCICVISIAHISPSCRWLVSHSHSIVRRRQRHARLSCHNPRAPGIKTENTLLAQYFIWKGTHILWSLCQKAVMRLSFKWSVLKYYVNRHTTKKDVILF